MLRKGALTGFMMLAAMPAFAQKAEVGIFAGWVFADGVSGNAVVVPGVGTFDRIDPKDSFGWGFDVGVMVGPNAEVGFMYTQQPTKLEAGGTTTKEIGDMSTHTYHGVFTYNFGPGDSKIRPYVFGGLGGTSFGDVNYTRANGVSGTISGLSRFSTTWGAGVNVYGSGHVGGRFGIRLTPAYIKSDAAGWWCDPYGDRSNRRRRGRRRHRRGGRNRCRSGCGIGWFGQGGGHSGPDPPRHSRWPSRSRWTS